MKVKIQNIKIEDQPNGKWGPAKKITFKEILPGGDRWISGFLNLKDFDSKIWVNGNEVEMDVTQNEKGFWNFRILKGTSSQEKNKAEAFAKLEAISTKCEMILFKTELIAEYISKNISNKLDDIISRLEKKEFNSKFPE